MSCNIYEFGASLQATSTGTTAECPENVQWPSDLYTRSGGSQVFGGPISNGTLHFHAFPFLAESQLTQIAFKVEEESVVFIRVDSVWIDRIHGTLQVLGESSEPMVTAHLDNAISLMVSNTDTVYTISLNVVSVNSNPGECLYFGLQVDIEPYQAALDDLRCGDGTLDMISETLSVSSTQSVSHIAGVEVTGGQWSQLIHLTSSSNFTAFIFVDYWAVSEDVSLEIVQGEAVQRASPESVDQGKWSSRAVIGPTMFPPGDYTVHIAVSRSDILPDAQQGDCLSFFYGLQASSDRSPHINQITPFEGTSLQRDRDLVVLLQFSEPVGVPTPSDLTSTVLENRAIVLYANAVSILPESVRFFGDIAVEARFNQSRLVNVRVSVEICRLTLVVECWFRIASCTSTRPSLRTNIVLHSPPQCRTYTIRLTFVIARVMDRARTAQQSALVMLRMLATIAIAVMLATTYTTGDAYLIWFQLSTRATNMVNLSTTVIRIRTVCATLAMLLSETTTVLAVLQGLVPVFRTVAR